MTKKELLLDLANYLDSGKTATPLTMKCFPHCALGQSVRRRHPELDTIAVAQMASQTEHERYGVDRTSLDYIFMFGSQWSNCPHAAAERIRYVAIHGSCPSKDQWDRFGYSNPEYTAKQAVAGSIPASKPEELATV